MLNIEYQRLFDKSIMPTEETISSLLDQNYSIWKEIHDYIQSVDKIRVETKYFAKNHGWSRRFYKGAKTICYLFPESNAFSILIVFGQKEVIRIEEIKTELNKSIYDSILNTEHFHDGRWVWFRINENTDMHSIKKVIDIKTNRKNT